jgi:hypothetical protein
MKNIQKHIFNKELKWRLAVALIAFATNIAIYNLHPPSNKTAAVTRKDIRKMFEHEKETLHAPHNYGARGRYTIILGSE